MTPSYMCGQRSAFHSQVKRLVPIVADRQGHDAGDPERPLRWVERGRRIADRRMRPQTAQTGHTFGVFDWCCLLKLLVLTHRVK